MGLITKIKSWVDNDTVAYTDLNGDFDTIYDEFNGNIDNSNIKSGAAIDKSKIANTALTLTDAQTATNKTFTAPTITAPVITTWDGWTTDANTWTYASATTFTIAVDMTTYYLKGVKIRFKQGGGYQYFDVASSVFSAGITTVTLVPNTDYALTNTTITKTFFSFQTPADFPSFFNYTATVTGFTTTTTTHQYRINGGLCYVLLYNTSLVSNGTSFNITGPIVSAAAPGTWWFTGGLMTTDNDTAATTPAVAGVVGGSSTIKLAKDATQAGGGIFGGYTNGNHKFVQGTVIYPI